MNNIQLAVTLLLLAAGLWLTRFLPFVIFKKTEKLPKIIEYMGRVLPAAMMGLLVVYCFKGCDFSDITAVLPLVLSVAAVTVLHLLKHNTILSISVGTAVYMILIRLI